MKESNPTGMEAKVHWGIVSYVGAMLALCGCDVALPIRGRVFEARDSRAVESIKLAKENEVAADALKLIPINKVEVYCGALGPMITNKDGYFEGGYLITQLFFIPINSDWEVEFAKPGYGKLRGTGRPLESDELLIVLLSRDESVPPDGMDAK